MQITKEEFGAINQKVIHKYTLKNANNTSAEIINYGGTLVSFTMPDKQNNFQNINLGFNNLTDYQKHSPFFGALIGRFGNRIANGAFTLDGINYQVTPSEKNNHLHGGKIGFDKVIWNAEEIKTNDSVGLLLKYSSVDGEEGYPGTVNIEVTYLLTNDNELSIEYNATTDKATPINMTQHSYWNLSGDLDSTVLDHQLHLNCDKYLPVNKQLLPTGEIQSVQGTPMDFTTPHLIGDDLKKIKGGYDHCFIINKEQSNDLLHAATLYCERSGREMKITTTKPAIQFYSGNFLKKKLFRSYPTFRKHAGLCLETEYYPDAVNHTNFPSCILRPGETYHHLTVHKFDVK